MADMSISVTIEYNKFRDIAQRTPGGISGIVYRSAGNIVKRAQGRARVDTGRMKRETRILHSGMFTATVGAMAPYSGYLDQGTRYIRADYWFTNSVRDEQQIFLDELSALLTATWS